ncbi:MAG: hypothetical protein CK528_09500, partial [Alcaligenaceae bacterium]
MTEMFDPTHTLEHVNPIRLPLTGAQKNVWYHQLLEPESTPYNVLQFIRITGPFNCERARQSLEFLIQDTEAFRLKFCEEDGEVYQIVEPSVPTILSYFDVSSALDVEQKALETLEQEQHIVFDLRQACCFRFGVVKLSSSDWIWYWNGHHIATDGVGAANIVNNFSKAYRQFPNVSHSESPTWQNVTAEDLRYATSAERLLDQQFWLDNLKGLAAPSALCQRDVDNTAMSVPGIVTLDMERSYYDAFVAWGRKQTRSAYSAMAVAAIIYLYKLTGQRDICIGTPASGRTNDTRSFIGMLTNVMPLRVAINPLQTVNELIQDISGTMRLGLSHNRLPLREIIEQRRAIGLGDPFSLLVNLESFDQSLDFGDAHGIVHTMSSAPVADLQLYLFDRKDDGPVQLRIDYNKDRYSASDVQAHLERLSNLIGSLVAQADCSISQIVVTSSSERQSIVNESAGSVVDLNQWPQTLAELFKRQALHAPTASALVFEAAHGWDSLTYAEIDHRSNQLARDLLAKGVGSEQIVAILLDRSPAMIIALLAVVKVGAAYLPLDPDSPAARLTFMLEDSKSRCLISSEKLVNDLIDSNHLTNIDIVWIDSTAVARRLNTFPSTEILDAELHYPIHPESLAYVIYTSGSTGRPKAAGISQFNICQHLAWRQDTLKLNSTDRVLQKTAAGFDVSVWEWFLPLIAGSTLVIAKPEGHRDTVYLRKVVHQQQITLIHFVASMLAVFLDDLPPGECSSIRQVVTGGEALSGLLQQRTHQAILGVTFWNFYGPTEATIDVSHWCTRLEDDNQTPPIGHPIWNTQLYILDQSLEPVPQGSVGELYLVGTGLGRGYLGRSALTAERFIACPFGVPGARMYRSGDLARRRADGAIEYLG